MVNRAGVSSCTVVYDEKNETRATTTTHHHHPHVFDGNLAINFKHWPPAKHTTQVWKFLVTSCARLQPWLAVTRLGHGTPGGERLRGYSPGGYQAWVRGYGPGGYQLWSAHPGGEFLKLKNFFFKNRKFFSFKTRLRPWRLPALGQDT